MLQMAPLTRNLTPRFHLKVRGREEEENQAGEKEQEKQNAILKTKVILCMHATRWQATQKEHEDPISTLGMLQTPPLQGITPRDSKEKRKREGTSCFFIGKVRPLHLRNLKEMLRVGRSTSTRKRTGCSWKERSSWRSKGLVINCMARNLKALWRDCQEDTRDKRLQHALLELEWINVSWR